MPRRFRGPLVTEGVQTGACAMDECSAPIKAVGLCGKHYERKRVHGDPSVKLTAYGDSLPQRLASKVVMDGGLLGCWLWQANIDIYGYAIVKVDGKNRKAHRVAYELFIGPIPEGHDADHLCRVRHCVNPLHIEPVTSAENQRRGLNGVLKVECRNGHPYTEKNVRLDSRGRRRCVLCAKAAQEKYQQKQRQEANR